MRAVQGSSSGTTWNPMRRGPLVSHKTVIILIGSGVAAVVTVLAVTIVALICCRVKRRKHKHASQAILGGRSSPMDSFIQYPPRLFERPVTASDVHLHSHRYTPSSDFTSQTIPDEDLDGPIRGSSLTGSNSPQDSGLGVSISSVSKGEPQKMLLGITPTGFFDNAHPRESLLSTYSTESFSPSQAFPVFQSESGEPPRTSTPFGPNARQAPVFPTPMQAQPLHRRATSIADSEMMSLRSTNTRHASRPLTNPPIRDRGPPPSREFNSFPGLPSSPVATLTLSRSASEQDLMPNRIPPLLGNSYAFLDSPPRRKPPLGTRSIGHSRSLSESFAPSRPVGPGISQTETLDSKPSPSPNYASVAYAREKALQSARPRAKSVLPPVRTPSSSTRGPINHSRPNVKDHGAVIGTLNRQSQNELPVVLLSSRRRSRPHSRTWSIGKDAPERI